MKRSFSWGAIAIAPLALLLFLANAPGIEELLGQYATTSSFAEFMAKYWWVTLGLAVVAHAICFAVAALRNRAIPAWRRVLWSLGMVFCIPFIVPIYWWLHSEPAPNADA